MKVGHVKFYSFRSHRGDNSFSAISRGRLCAFMSFSALLCANSCDVLTWTTETIDGILIQGDAMYRKAFEERSISDDETISSQHFTFDETTSYYYHY